MQDFDRLGRRNHDPRRFGDSETLLKAFPSVALAFRDGKVVPLDHMTATGLICVCGSEVEIGRGEIAECPTGDRWFLRVHPDHILAATPGAIEDD